MNGRKVLIVGPYGGANLGDDAIGASICHYFIEKGFAVTITTIGGGRFEPINEVKSLQLPFLRKFVVGALSAIKQFDYVVIGGGQQIQEPRIPNPLWGHLANVFHFAIAARLYKKRFFVLGVGVDKKISRIGRFMIRRLYKNSEILMVRDQESRENLRKQIGGDANKVFLGADMVFLSSELWLALVKSAESKGISTSFLNESEYLVFIPSFDAKHVKDKDQMLLIIRKLSAYVDERGLKLLIMTSDMQPNIDGQVYQYKEQILKNNKNVVFVDHHELSLTIFLAFLSKSKGVISCRMHPIILTLILKVPFFNIVTSPKMIAFMSKAGSHDWIYLAELFSKNFEAKLDESIMMGFGSNNYNSFISSERKRLVEILNDII